jgi:hypothetical protein
MIELIETNGNFMDFGTNDRILIDFFGSTIWEKSQMIDMIEPYMARCLPLGGNMCCGTEMPSDGTAVQSMSLFRSIGGHLRRVLDALQGWFQGEPGLSTGDRHGSRNENAHFDIKHSKR